MKKLALLVCVLILAAGCAHAVPMRPAEKIAVGATTHFTLDKDEQKDFAIQLPKGSYYIIWDIARMDGKPLNISAKVQLLKSNGSIVNSRLMVPIELEPVVRCGSKFTIPKPLSARLRCSNEEDPIDVWMTIVPLSKMKFIPFAFLTGEIKPLGIGTNEGKGGTLDHDEWAIHSAKLPAGKYDVSLYLRRQDGKKNDTVMGDLERWDANGFRVPMWKINVAEIGVEARKDQRLILTKPATVIFRVLNTDAPVEYTVGIEKATD